MNITPFPTLSPATIDAINVIGQWLAQDDFSGEVPYQADCVILAGNASKATRLLADGQHGAMTA